MLTWQIKFQTRLILLSIIVGFLTRCKSSTNEDLSESEIYLAATNQCQQAQESIELSASPDGVIYRLPFVRNMGGEGSKGIATYKNGKWNLTQPFPANSVTPHCLTEKLALSHQEFLGALGCEKYTCDDEREIVDVKYEEHQAFLEKFYPGGVTASTSSSLGLIQTPRSKFPFKENECEDSRRYYHSVVLDGGTLKCKPDTLYSWGPMAKIEWLINEGWSKSHFKHFKNRTQNASLFATTNPLGSFGYGPYQIRIKLKSDVKFKVLLGKSGDAYAHCKNISKADAKNTVIVRYFDPRHFNTTISGLDWIVCGPGPIESWSYGMKESLDEILLVDKEYWNFRNAGGWYQNKKWYYYLEYYAKKNGVDIFDKNGNPDSMNFTYSYYKQNLTKHKALAGKVFVNPQGGNKNRHFETKFPFYFNPK